MDQILLFLKAPQPGRVKTRLAASIGFEAATDLYRCFGLDWCDRLHRFCQFPPVSQFPPVTLRVMYSPPEARAAIIEWLGDSKWGDGISSLMAPQSNGNLGDRLHQGLITAFASGAKRAIAVGTDSPDLPFQCLQTLLESLKHHDCGLIPSTDGGYCAIGFNHDTYEPAVFENMEWSTETVCQDTLDKLRSHQRSVLALNAWTDVDTLDDLRVLVQRLEDEAIAPKLPRTQTWLQQNPLP